MKGKYIEKFFTGDDADAEKTLPKRPKEIEEKEEKAYEEFFGCLTEKQKQKYVQFSFQEGGRAAFESEVMYRRGFRSGARLMLEILLEDE